jgi:hypothetical protein
MACFLSGPEMFVALLRHTVRHCKQNEPQFCSRRAKAAQLQAWFHSREEAYSQVRFGSINAPALITTVPDKL